mgnify:CR=1 FL=1
MPHATKKGSIEIAMIATMVVSIAGFSLALWTKNKVENSISNKLGAVTALSDTINTFRTNVNSTDETLRSTTSTDPGHLHTTSSITGIDYIHPVAQGGIGTSTNPSDGQFLSASDTIPTWKTFVGSGVTIAHSPTSTSFTTVGLDTSLNYSWTGTHTFSATTTQASSTFIGGVLNVSSTATFQATTTFNGRTVGLLANNLIAATTTAVSNPNTTATTTLLTVAIPANTIGKNNNSIQAEIWLDTLKITGSDTKFNASYGGVEFAKVTWPASGISCTNASPCAAFITLDVQARNSTSSQLGSMEVRMYAATASTSTLGTTIQFGLPTFTTIAATSTIDQTLLLTVTAGAAHATEQNVTMEKYTVTRVQAQ